MAQEGIATLPMQPMPEESQGIGAFEQQATATPEVTEQDRFEAVMGALRQQLPEIADKVEQILDEANLTPEQVDALSDAIQFIEANKDNYQAVLQSLIEQGDVEPGVFPPEYNEEFMVLLKMVVYGYQARQATPEPVPFAKGGLAQAAEALRQQGRGGDTILAHINPQEAAMLKRMGGSGTINPATGLVEFKGGNPIKSVAKAVTKPIKAVTKAVGSAVKSVVGAASKILGPQLTSIVATVGGFMIGGPAGAALAQGLVTYGQGGSFKDVLLNSATAYIGGTYGPTAGAIAGGGATMLRGGSLKDAVKAAAISYGTSYAMGKVGELGSQGQAPEGPNLSRAGTLDANGNFVPDASVATPGSVSAVNPTGTGQPSVLTPGQVTAAAPSGTTSQFGINAGPAPSAPTAGGSQFGSLNFQAPSYALNAPASASAPAGISSLGGAPTASSPGFFNSLMGGNFSDAGRAALNYAKANPMTTAGMILGGTALAGGFTPQPVSPPNLLERGPDGKPITGEDVVAADPNRYIVQNIPGVNYNPAGGIDFTRPNTVPTQFNIQPGSMGAMPTVANSPLYGAPPSYQPPQNAVGSTPNTGIQQPYNTANMYDFMNYNPYAPRRLNMGGPVMGGPQPEFMPGSAVAMYNKGGISQYPRRTGQISGPGTETSDDIPAMLSDGEFVITAKAVRGMGGGSRREGAKKLYRMMHALEKKAGGKV